MLTTTVTRNSATGNSATTAFPFTFKIFSKVQLVVEVDGTTQTEGVHYAVSTGPWTTGGTVTFTVAPATGALVVLRRSTTIQQATNLVAQSTFSSQTLEDALDYLAMMIQELNTLVRGDEA